MYIIPMSFFNMVGQDNRWWWPYFALFFRFTFRLNNSSPKFILVSVATFIVFVDRRCGKPQPLVCRRSRSVGVGLWVAAPPISSVSSQSCHRSFHLYST